MTSPVLLLVFNRPDTTQLVFDEIRRARPERLYVAADGPRTGRPGEAALCAETRRVVSNVDWECDVKTLFRNENLGCGRAVSEAISWFFEHESEGVILEDGCIPHQSFFRYCTDMLSRYRDEPSVFSISGSSFFRPVFRQVDYKFTYYPDMWGWATWRRAWRKYDFGLETWEGSFPEEKAISSRPRCVQQYWSDLFNRTKSGEIDTWDFQWIWTVMREGGVSATPLYNMITNKGFRPDAAHTVEDRFLANRQTEPAEQPLRHPKTLERSADLEAYLEASRLSVPRERLSERALEVAKIAYADLTTYEFRRIRGKLVAAAQLAAR